MPWFLQTARLIRCRHHCWSRAGRRTIGEICFLQDHRPLKNHLNLTTRLDVYVGSAREQRYESDGGQACSNSAKPAGQRMS
jgi:hypothetical protein